MCLLLYAITGHSKVIENVISVPDNLNFGKVLIGAAEVKPEAIQWVGQGSTLVTATFDLPMYGFTGEHSYLNSINKNEKGSWRIGTSSAGYSISPIGTSPKVGIFFAPQRVGANDASLGFTWPQTHTEQVIGEGILDADNALTLEIIPNGYVEEGVCEGKNNCRLLSISSSPITFTITPRVDTAKVPTGVKADYLLIKLDVVEQNTQCSTNNTSVQEKIGTPLSYSVLTQYFDYLSPLRPEEASVTCRRGHLFLVSKDYPIRVTAGRIKDTGAGYVEYAFSTIGHPVETFRLKTSGNIVSPSQTASLTVRVTGDGQVSTSDGKISDCTSSCTATYSTNSRVTLVASNSNVSWGGSCTGSTDRSTAIIGQSAVTCIANFTSTPLPDSLTARFTATPTQGTAPLTVSLNATNSTGNISQYRWDITSRSNNVTILPELKNTSISSVKLTTPGVYTITLVVADALGNTSTTTRAQVVVESAPITDQLTANFVIKTPSLEEILAEEIAPLSLILEASDRSADSYQWFILQKTSALFTVAHPEKSTKAVQPIVLPKAGTYVIVLKVEQGDQSALTSQTITLPQPLAAFTATPVAGQLPLSVYLDATQTLTYFEKMRGKQIIDWQWWRSDGVLIENNGQSSTTTAFLANGNYVVTLLVTDETGQFASASQTVSVGDFSPPTAEVDVPQWLGSKTLSLRVDGSASTAIGSEDNPTARLTDYQWLLKDLNGKELFFDQSVPIVTLPLSEEGTYQVILQVTDNIGLTSLAGTGFMQASPGTAIDTQGYPAQTNSTFLSHLGKYTFNTIEPIYLYTDVSVATIDTNQNAETLVVVMTPQRQLFMRVQQNPSDLPEFVSWNGDIGILEAVEGGEKRLTDLISVPIMTEQSIHASGLGSQLGTYSAWVGYRLENGVIIFNLYPFTFNIKE